MATNVPNIPLQSPIADGAGMISQAWANWMRDLFKRAGGGQALSNTELAAEFTSGTVGAQISALQSSVASLNVSVATLTTGVAGLNQGRQL